MGAEGKREAAGGEESTLEGARPRERSDARGIRLRCVNNFCYYFVFLCRGGGKGGGALNPSFSGRGGTPLPWDLLTFTTLLK